MSHKRRFGTNFEAEKTSVNDLLSELSTSFSTDPDATMIISKICDDFEGCGDIVDVIRHQIELAKNLKVRLDSYHDQHEYMTAKLQDEDTEVGKKRILGLASAEILVEANAETLSEYLREETNSDMDSGSLPTTSLNINALLSIAPKTIEFFKEIMKAKELEDVGVLFDDSRATSTSFPESNEADSSIKTASEEAKQRIKSKDTKELLLWIVVACFLAAHFPWWKSRFFYLIIQHVLDCREVPAAANIIAKLLPGTYTIRQQRAIHDKHLGVLEKEDHDLDMHHNLIKFIFDNIQLKHARTTETGAGKTGVSVDVHTMRIYLKYACEKWAALQFDFQHPPLRMSAAYPLSDVPLSCMEIRQVSDDDDEDKLSEEQYLDNEWCYSLLSAVESVRRDGNSWATESRGESLAEELQIKGGVANMRKICLDGCRKLENLKGEFFNLNFNCVSLFLQEGVNPNRHMICGACGARLPSMKMQQLHADRDNAAGDHEDSQLMSSSTKVKKQRKIKNEVENATEKVMKVTLPSYARVDGDFTADAAMTGAPVPVERVVLPLLHLNPGVHENQKKITDGLLKLVNRGEMGGALTASITTDAGATDFKKILADGVEEWWVTIGLGHTEMAVTRLCMRVCVACLGDSFIFAHKFKEGTGGPDYLKSCKSNHKAWVFTRLCEMALNVELFKAFLQHRRTLVEEDLTCSSTDARDLFKTFLLVTIPDQNDAILLNLVLASRILSAGSLLRKSCRARGGRGNYFAQSAAMKMFIPLFYKLGFNKYGPLMHWEYVRTMYRVTKEVKDMLVNTSCVNGQGTEFHIEEDIQRVVRSCHGRKSRLDYPTTVRILPWLILSILIGNFLRDLARAALNLQTRPARLHAVNKILGITATYGRRWRTLISRVEDKAAFDEVFRLHNTVQLTPGRTVITSVDTRYEWVMGVNLAQVMQLGADAMQRNQESGFKISVGCSMKLLSNVEELSVDRTGTSLPADNFEEEEEIEANASECIAEETHSNPLCPGEPTSATIANDTNTADFDSDDNDGSMEDDDESGSDDDDVILILNNGL